MPNVTVYIRKDDWELWKSIEDKPGFIHHSLKLEREGTLPPEPIKPLRGAFHGPGGILEKGDKEGWATSVTTAETPPNKATLRECTHKDRKMDKRFRVERCVDCGMVL